MHSLAVRNLSRASVFVILVMAMIMCLMGFRTPGAQAATLPAKQNVAAAVTVRVSDPVIHVVFVRQAPAVVRTTAPPKTAMSKSTPPKLDASAETYTVQSGDTLSGIAASHGTTWRNLQEINHLPDPNLIYPGQVLKLAGTATTAPTKAAPAQTYTVQSGDTLSGIAASHQISWQQLQQANNIADANLIQPGHVLKLSSNTATSQETPAPQQQQPQQPIQPASTSDHVTGSNNVEIAYNYFLSRGLDKIHSAAIVGNLIQESNVDPGIVQYGGGPGHGIAQWSEPGRWDDLLQHEGGNTDLMHQLDFVWYELHGDYSDAFSNFENATSLDEATMIIAHQYEQCGIDGPRTADAWDVLNRYGG